MAEAVLTCPRCARPAPAGAANCPYDGTPLTDGSAERTYAAAKSASARGLNDWNEPTSLRAPGRPASTVLVSSDQSGEPDRPGDALIGAQLGDYVVKERLGSGGMGIVYAGEQPLIGKKVAIKVLKPDIAADEKNVARLLAEARAVNAIRHRGIIDIFNFGRLPDGRNYIVMEYLAGEPLDAMMYRRGALPALEVVDILDEILSALGAGHGAGIIHRDLKPSNIHIVTQPNGQKYIKLLDFGLAKSGMLSPKAMTHTNVVVGTPEYMAPEQARAEPVSPQSDLYALGIIAFELLTGKLPFSATSPFEWMMHQVNTPAPKPSSLEASVPPRLDALILRMLAKKEAERPPTADAIREELASIRQSLASAAMAAVPMTGFRAAGGPTGPKTALTDEALAAARAQREAAVAVAPRPSAPKQQARGERGKTGPRPGKGANGKGAAQQPGRSKTDGAAAASAPQRSDTILSEAMPSVRHRSPQPNVPVLAIALACVGVLAAGGGYYVYRQPLEGQPLRVQPEEPTVIPSRDDTPKVVETAEKLPAEAAAAVDESKHEPSAVHVAATNAVQQKEATKKEPVVRPTRRAVLQSEISSLVGKLQDTANVKLEEGSIELVRTKLKAVKNQLNDAASDKDFDSAEKQLRDIRKQHFR